VQAISGSSLPINTKPEDFPITTEDINRLGTNIYVRTLEA
jgi:hypothetical protein